MAWYHVILYWMTHAWDIHGKMPGFHKKGGLTQQVLAAVHVCERRAARMVLEINSLQLF